MIELDPGAAASKSFLTYSEVNKKLQSSLQHIHRLEQIFFSRDLWKNELEYHPVYFK